MPSLGSATRSRITVLEHPATPVAMLGGSGSWHMSGSRGEPPRRRLSAALIIAWDVTEEVSIVPATGGDD